MTVRAHIPLSRDVARVTDALSSLPPYVFAELDRLKKDARRRGIEFTDLGIGSPDRPIPAPIIDALQRAATDPSTHGYPPFRGGPLRTIDRIGATRVLDVLRGLENVYGRRFTPAPALVEVGTRNGRFTDDG